MKQHTIGLGIAFAVALGIAGTVPAQEAVQWRVEDGGNGHWYQRLVPATPVTWTEAKLLCEGAGGYLATLPSAAEDAFVRNIIGPIEAYLGGLQSANSCEPGCGWQWLTGEPWIYTSWNAFEPNNSNAEQDFLRTYSNGNWDDIQDDYPFPFGIAIEWSADCNGDGIVDYGQCRDGSLPDYDGDNIPDCCEAGTPCTVGNYPVQWRVEEGGNGHWYAKVAASPLPTTIAAMQGFAAGRGADLASITSSGENATILSLLGAIGAGESHSAWIGLYRPMPGDPWRWTDGSATTWGGWGSASCVSGPYPNDMPFPGELGTVIYRQNCGLVWDDSATAWIQNPPPWWGGVANMTLVLEWSADCNGDGIVDYGQILDGTFADTDSNGVPDVCEVDPCPGDVTDNGVVDGVDLSLILALWGTSGQKFPRSDANGDGTVDANDLAIVLSGWGSCPD